MHRMGKIKSEGLSFNAFLGGRIQAREEDATFHAQIPWRGK